MTDRAKRALSLLDLTDLNDGTTSGDIDIVCEKADGPCGRVAAVCIWPQFITQAKEKLAGTGIKIATVVNFPEGGEDTIAVEAEVEAALNDGADEIDLVMPYKALLEGRPGFAETQIVRIRRVIGERGLLKVILETGELKQADAIRLASDVAIGAGADFIKTSTGKVAVNATLEAAEIMLNAIKDSAKPVGFKAAGGIRTGDDAQNYLDLADKIMGPDWANSDTFRFGASGLLSALEAELGAESSKAGASDY